MSSFRLLRLVFAFLYRQNRIGNSAAQTNIYRLLAKSRKIARLARECWQQLQTHPSVCLFRRTQNIFFRIYRRLFGQTGWLDYNERKTTMVCWHQEHKISILNPLEFGCFLSTHVLYASLLLCTYAVHVYWCSLNKFAIFYALLPLILSSLPLPSQFSP